MTITENFHNSGFQLKGEGKRLDVVDSEGKKHLEIIFFLNEVLIMSPIAYEWKKNIRLLDVQLGRPIYC